MPSVDKQAISAFFKEHDKNSDGLINIFDLIRGLSPYCKPNTVVSTEIKTLFDQIDLQKMEKITKLDLQRYLQKIDPQNTDSNQIDNFIQKLFREIDFMHTGFISYWDLFLE